MFGIVCRGGGGCHKGQTSLPLMLPGISKCFCLFRRKPSTYWHCVCAGGGGGGAGGGGAVLHLWEGWGYKGMIRQ